MIQIEKKLCNRGILTKYELQLTVIYTVFLHFLDIWMVVSTYIMSTLLSHVLIQLAMTNNLCSYQMSFLETQAGPKMDR